MRRTCSTCGYCKSGVLLSEVFNGREDPCETCEVITVNEFTNWHPIPITHADKIRSMTDEELAGEMSVRLSENCLMCPVMEADCPVWESKDIECKDAMLEWLKSPTEVDT